jgi:hypothetical protein
MKMKIRVGFVSFMLAIALLFSTNAWADAPAGASYWVDPSAPGAPTATQAYGFYDTYLFTIRTYSPKTDIYADQGCWNLGYRYTYEPTIEADDFGGNASLWGTLTTDPDVGWPYTYVNVCVYPRSSAGAGYVHPPSWFVQGELGSCALPDTVDADAGNLENPVNTQLNNKINLYSSVDLKSGNVYHSQSAGLLTLSYNSREAAAGALGAGWTHHLNVSLSANADQSLALRGYEFDTLNWPTLILRIGPPGKRNRVPYFGAIMPERRGGEQERESGAIRADTTRV